MRALVLVALAGCWTSSPSAPTTPANVEPAPSIAPRPMRFQITLERTACLGNCPVYKVTIHGTGQVDWEGIQNVAAIGRLDGKSVVPRGALERLTRQIDDVKFFDRKPDGELETGPICTTTGNTTTCSASVHICTDTTHARITVSRSGRTHVIDNDHCDDKPGIDELEETVDALAGTAELIGR